MNAVAIASITFICTFVSSWLGTLVRAALPPAHMSKESQDVVRLGMGLVATMTALLLGLVTASAKGSFDSQDQAVRNSAANILTLDRHLEQYGPETKSIRELLRSIVRSRYEQIWSHADPHALESASTKAPVEEIQSQLLALAPATEAQRWFRSESLRLTDELLRTRWRVLDNSGGSVPTAFLGVIIFWLTVTFASFGLYAPRNATVLSVFFLASLSVAAAVFLILELDTPFNGLLMISGGSWRYALAHLGQ